METLILTGWGWKDYACAAAAVLRKTPDADISGCSTRRLPEMLTEISNAPSDKLKNIIIIGIGWRGDSDDLLKLVKQLRQKKISISWLSVLPLPEWLPSEFQDIVDCQIGVDGECLTEWVAKIYQVPVADLLQIVEHDAQNIKKSHVAQKLLLLETTMYFYRNYQDDDAYGKAIRTLAEKRGFTEEQQKMMKYFEYYGARELIGQSPMIRQLRELINKVGPKDHARVVIRGETGTGKETVALQLHFKSPRKQEPFIAANCATLNPQLLVSQLFGHEKGSFTGASSLQRGCFEEANGGTLFLDEVGELPLEAQAGLLRVLQEGRFYRLGGTKEIKVDVRVIAATNRNLTDMVKKGEFRDDLFHRLNMVPIHITPLRERPEDISMIANAFWMNQHRERLTDKQIYALQNYDWPGNVRELHNILNLADIFEEEDFDKLIEENRSQWENNDRAEKTKRKDYPENLQEIIREHVQKILKKYDGNISRTANAMGITRNTLKKYMN